jgi:hypothetical protein
MDSCTAKLAVASLAQKRIRTMTYDAFGLRRKKVNSTFKCVRIVAILEPRRRQ